jgi:nitrogen fixation protein FixH
MIAVQPFSLRGWHVLAAFVAFFAIIIGLDVGFAVVAYRSFPGQSAANPYEAGLQFNRTLAQRRAEAALGWRAEASQDASGVEFRFLDAQGAAVPGLAVTGRATRPATESGARALAFTQTAPGVFRAARPGYGAWDIAVTAQGMGDARFEAERRLTWP